MHPLTAEWISKAEGDFASAQRELRARNSPNYDAACFHAQQCAEKYLKARLQEAGQYIPRTHDLVVLLNLLLPVEPAWAHLTSDLRAGLRRNLPLPRFICQSCNGARCSKAMQCRAKSGAPVIGSASLTFSHRVCL